jgi:hypothetical protein
LKKFNKNKKDLQEIPKKQDYLKVKGGGLTQASDYKEAKEGIN